MTIDIGTLTNSELEEMGLPLPCDCREFTREYDDVGIPFNVCDDCGTAYAVTFPRMEP